MEEQRQQEGIDFGTLLWNLRQGLKAAWWLVPVLTLLGAAFGLGKVVMFYSPMYRSEASFTVLTEHSGNGDAGNSNYYYYYDSATAGQLAKTFPYILSSGLFTDAIKADLDIDSLNGNISASAVPESNLITMSVTSSDPGDAKQILESAIKVYPDVAKFVLGSINFNMIDVPEEPSEPYNQPNYTKTMIKYGLAGMLASLALIMMIALAKRTVQKPEELKSVISLECLGNLPEVKFKARTNRDYQKLSLLNKRLPQGYKESILSVLVRVDREMKNKKAKVLMITSTNSGEGKSALAVNLAIAAASQGKRVMLLDGDLRKQSDRRLITDTVGYGLESVVEGECSLKEALVKDEASGVWLLCGTRKTAHVQKVLNSSEVKKIVETCKAAMDLVIIDAPPCELFEDANVLAEHADCTLYVLRHDYVQKRKLIQGISDLEDSSAPLLGYVFNRVPVHQGRYGYYSYGYGRYGYGYYGYGGKYSYGYKDGSGYGKGSKHRRK